ncbi:MAG: polysaccharide biosynthesis tyrosine autokinase [Anaerolineaceae bacterium]
MEIYQSPNENGTENVDLRKYLSLFLHWAWLIILAGLLAGAFAYFFSQRMTPYYQSSTTVLVNAAPGTKATDYTSVMLSEQLTSTYAKMIVTDPVLNQMADDLGLTMQMDEIKKSITVTPVSNTQLLQITVETTDPELSARIANAVVMVFANQIQQLQSQRFAQSESSLETQMADVEKKINDFEDQAILAVTVEEKDRLDAKVTQYRTMYSNLLQTYEQVRLTEAQSVSSIDQVEYAIPNPKPVKPKVLQNTLLAALVGLMIVAGAVVAQEALDDSIKTPEDITQNFKLPVLGVIDHHKIEVKNPISLSDSRSPTAEAYRTLRTNVSYTSVDHPLHTLMITSSETGEGKTTTVANLGVVMAQNGKRVIIVDCDLRHPRVHTYFGLTNRNGLTELLAQKDIKIDGANRATKVNGLSIVSSGSLPPNPAELLGSQKMQSILKTISQSADIILIDTPPTLAVTDAAVLASTMDGVLLIVRPGKTRIRALRQTLDQMNQVNARVLGVILNNVETRFSSYGYHYRYYRDYSAYQQYYGHKGKKARKS